MKKRCINALRKTRHQSSSVVCLVFVLFAASQRAPPRSRMVRCRHSGVAEDTWVSQGDVQSEDLEKTGLVLAAYPIAVQMKPRSRSLCLFEHICQTCTCS